jgi:hypothetical protein
MKVGYEDCESWLGMMKFESSSIVSTVFGVGLMITRLPNYLMYIYPSSSLFLKLLIPPTRPGRNAYVPVHVDRRTHSRIATVHSRIPFAFEQVNHPCHASATNFTYPTSLRVTRPQLILREIERDSKIHIPTKKVLADSILKSMAFPSTGPGITLSACAMIPILWSVMSYDLDVAMSSPRTRVPKHTIVANNQADQAPAVGLV